MSVPRPIRSFAVLVDEQPETDDNGVIVTRGLGATRLDYTVARVDGTDEFGQGDKVILDDPNTGRRVFVDGVLFRVVSTSHVLAVVE